ncbi:hypothetical protein HBA54_24825 [Pelagibius litoralis]|uniref:Uncharacterized protein n=1 Tax=Pelagibius litoralis TaxID=374515 RepID=A0A967F2D7_9PROT|nr:hypothetical protein [Pelagibius litoralis]NIA71825.1 hypothetical protein [Pelagibius litoralis]
MDDTMNKSAYQRNLEKVPPCYRKVVDDLDVQFGAVTHDLWVADRLNVAPSSVDFAQSIRNSDPDELTNRELDYLAFTAITTMGGVPTLKFVLPRFFAAYFASRLEGWTVAPDAMLERLQLANVEEWTPLEQLAASRALLAFAESELALLREDVASWKGDPEKAVDVEISAAADWATQRIASLSESPA